MGARAGNRPSFQSGCIGIPSHLSCGLRSRAWVKDFGGLRIEDLVVETLNCRFFDGMPNAARAMQALKDHLSLTNAGDSL